MEWQSFLESFKLLDLLGTIVGKSALWAPTNDGSPFSGNVLTNNGCAYRVYVNASEIGEIGISEDGATDGHITMEN